MKLNIYLEKKGISPSELAIKSCLYPNFIYDLMGGRRSRVNFESVIKLLNACEGNVSINDILEILGSDVRYEFEIHTSLSHSSRNKPNNTKMKAQKNS